MDSATTNESPSSARPTPGTAGREFFRYVPRETRSPYILICVFLWSVISFLLISRFVFGVVEVQGRSMETTLSEGDRFVLNRLAYYWREPQRGDLVVINDHIDDSLSVKRIVGLPGETFAIVRGKVWINGRALPEPYLDRRTWTSPQSHGRKPLNIPPGHYLVLGDNRAVSLDGRTYGPLDRKSIHGVIQY